MTPAEAIASLKVQIQNQVLRQTNERMAMTADRMALEIKKQVKKDLQTFFLEFRRLLQNVNDTPNWITDNIGYSWEDLNPWYVKEKKSGRIDFFVYSELPKLARFRKPRNRKKTLGGSERTRVSLRNVLAGITNPERIFGPLTVTVQSHTAINKAGKRYYVAGTTLDGVRAGGRLVQNGRDVVSIVVDWAPRFEGKNVLQRGVVESQLPRAGRLRQKLMNREGSYRALVGPRMLWYQAERLPIIIQNALNGRKK